MQDMFFIQVSPKKRGGFDLQCTGQVVGQIGQDDWAVRITQPAPVPYVRVLRTAQLREFCLFDTQEDLTTFGRANWPEIFPAPPAAPENPVEVATPDGVDANGSPVDTNPDRPA